jgi:hypothetical protein
MTEDLHAMPREPGYQPPTDAPLFADMRQLGAEEAKALVAAWREKNPEIAAFWASKCEVKS